MAVSILYHPYRNCSGGVPCKLFGFGAGFWAAGPVPKAWERSCDACGPILEAWRPFSTPFGPFRHFGPEPLSETSTSVLSQQQTSVLSQQQTSVLSQQQTSVLSQQKTSILSQQKTSQQPAGGRQLSRLLFRKALALPGRAVSNRSSPQGFN